MNNNTVTKHDIISDVMEEHPDSIEIFMEYGLGCVGCGIASFETIEEGATAHGLNDSDIDRLISDINDIESDKT